MKNIKLLSPSDAQGETARSRAQQLLCTIYVTRNLKTPHLHRNPTTYLELALELAYTITS